MALDMTPEQKAIGEQNFHRTVGQLAKADAEREEQQNQGGMSRRRFMQGMIAAGAGALPLAAGAYFGYTNASFRERPVKAGLIGAGDEGGVLVGEHNPSYVEFIAYSDIRPYNQRRIFRGEDRGPRKGFNRIYGNDAESRIRLYENWRDLLQNPDIEMVVIALPLHLHAPVAIAAMQAGKHVLCEKLMAWSIAECKEMNRVAQETGKILSIGHQRHYNMLYAHALEVIQTGVLGEIHHIRAQWHRNNAKPNPNYDPNNPDPNGRGPYLDSWRKSILEEDREHLQGRDMNELGFRDINELVRWRLYNRTGGGLMAELGSHQLDACSIFLGKVRPIAVTGVGGKHFYRDDRDVDDHVYCIYEFPGKNYPEDQNDRVVVTYSSINTNSFEPYGECVMGTKGTLVVSQEQSAMLWGVSGRSTAVSVNTSGSSPVLSSSGSEPPDTTAVQLGANSIGSATPSRGYREEMEHMAFIIRMRNEGMEADRNGPELQPRCGGEAAMADAIMALTSNVAMATNQRIEFQDEWYDSTNNAVPDGTNPDGTPRIADPFLTNG